MGVENGYAPKMWKSSKQDNNMETFRQFINEKYKLNLENYDSLWKWSVEEYDTFWENFWEFSGLKFSRPYTQVIDKSIEMEKIPEWFHDSKLNYAENLLSGKELNQVALYVAGEQMKIKKVTFGELQKNVAQIQSALRNCGIVKGDRVVGYIPNCELAVEAMLATASLGAVWSSTSPEFGVSGVLDRFQQIKPKVIFSVDAVVYNGKVHNHLSKLNSIVNGLPEVEKVVVLPYKRDIHTIDITQIRNSMFMSEFLMMGNEDSVLEYTQVPFNHPLFIMYSSGTTGQPKCMVHSVGGTLIQHLKEHMLHGNMTNKDIILYYTTTGWMMWNWLMSALALGAAIVLYDGSPLVPTPNVLWDLIDQIGITILGSGARWIEALEEKAVYPLKTHKLSSLHTILSTGSPLKPASYDYVYEKIKQNVLLGSISGGTDIISCFVGQNPSLPVFRGEIQSRNLGMAVESWSDDGQSVYDVAGELVCTKPFPSMPTRFWNDPNHIKYYKSYFNKFPGIWSHGDYCIISSRTGGIVMLGRSDGTLNPNGVRFGSAEIYNVVNTSRFKEVLDALCVGQLTKTGERAVLFLKLLDGHLFTEDLLKRIRYAIREELSARHVPEVILPIEDIPYTTSGKKVELAVKRILNGQEVVQRGALINPDSLDLYYNLTQLKL